MFSQENNSRTSTREFPNRMHIPKNLDDNVKLQDLTSSPITWILNVDESSRIEHKGFGLVLVDPDGY